MLAAFSQLPLNASAATQRCSVQGFSGACLPSTSCRASGGTSTASPSCKEDGTSCCYKASCAAGGSCKWTDQCTTGTIIKNLCPGPAEFQCCMTTPTDAPKVAPACGPSGSCEEPHESGPFTYVPLGDSYAAGLGSTDNYDPASGTCKRSPNAHPKLLANMLNAQLDFKACSGAVISDVRTQLGSLSDATNLVTLSVGGNDLGFTDVLKRCVKDVIHNCDVSERTKYASGELKYDLAAFYTEVKNKAKNARIVITGYPRLFADQLKDQELNCVARFSDWVSISEMTGLYKLADALSAAIKSAADSSGVEYVDVRKIFDDHAICDADAWLNGLNFQKQDETAHPNKKGQEAYAKAVMCQIRGQNCG